MASRDRKSNTPFKLLPSGPRIKEEHTGASDLLLFHGLRSHYETMCERPIASSLAESPHLRLVPGDLTIRRGEGMELRPLIERLGSGSTAEIPSIQQLDLDELRAAFTFRSSESVKLSEEDQGVPARSGDGGNVKESDRKNRKKHRESKERKRRKEGEKEEMERDKGKGERNGEEEKQKKHKKKKRKREGDAKDGEEKKHKKKKTTLTSKDTKTVISNGL